MSMEPWSPLCITIERIADFVTWVLVSCVLYVLKIVRAIINADFSMA